MLERIPHPNGWVLWTLDGQPAVWIRELGDEQRVIVWVMEARVVLGAARKKRARIAPKTRHGASL